MTIDKIRNSINSKRVRSAWERGVIAYANDLLDELETAISDGYFDAEDLSNWNLTERALLNGASDWRQYSEGGCALCYNHQIASRLCAPWELKKAENGAKAPNPRETWIDVQSRALYQAAAFIKTHISSER